MPLSFPGIADTTRCIHFSSAHKLPGFDKPATHSREKYVNHITKIYSGQQFKQRKRTQCMSDVVIMYAWSFEWTKRNEETRKKKQPS